MRPYQPEERTPIDPGWWASQPSLREATEIAVLWALIRSVELLAWTLMCGGYVGAVAVVCWWLVAG